jgi:hypothetical protein
LLGCGLADFPRSAYTTGLTAAAVHDYGT